MQYKIIGNTEASSRLEVGPHSLLARPTKSSGRAQGGIGDKQKAVGRRQKREARSETADKLFQNEEFMHLVCGRIVI